MADSISHVKRREIQAPIVATLINGFAKELGREKAMEIAIRTIQEDARADGQKTGLEYGRDLKGLAQVVKEVWCEDGGVIIDILEESDDTFAFNVKKCGYAEAYEKLGIKELGTCLSCHRDEPFAEAFGPNIKLHRTQTIMDGAPHCDFKYTRD
ncbi:MAG: L-2-amino-thiazoline-4-carboxylic acid hydrolase [Phycisphaerales bacterium]|nr:L-2-amino-thiazoline-4-carboxylic acid hydrolase [Phycisphaerales bacterium]